jgi:regulator of RNase E activity RraA
MVEPADLKSLCPTEIAELLAREQIMDAGIRPIWANMPRLAGPAYTARCDPGDSLMFHAAVHRAPPGSIIVGQGGDADYALAGGNVCAVAQSRGIAGFIIDGVVRDIGEIRTMCFPVFARGVIPIPARQCASGSLNVSVRCGGVTVSPGDAIVADEEGIVVLPHETSNEIIAAAMERHAGAQKISLENWSETHRKRIEAALRSNGFHD